MCVICVKPANVDFPSYATLLTMWDRNPDGAGFMYPDKGSVIIRKGFMTFESFDQCLFTETARHNLKSKTVVMHFRIGTHGGNTPGNTHPFPMVKSVDRMHAINEKCRVGVAHNGIINISPQRSDISDTMEYIRSVLVPASSCFTDSDWMYDETMLQFLERTINGSRMVFMRGSGDFNMVGNWVYDKGLWYSNRSYTLGKR